MSVIYRLTKAVREQLGVDKGNEVGPVGIDQSRAAPVVFTCTTEYHLYTFMRLV